MATAGDKLPNGWNEWSRHVLSELERLDDCYHSLNDKLDSVLIKTEVLRVKSGIWGMFGGLIPVVLALTYLLLSHHLGQKTP